MAERCACCETTCRKWLAGTWSAPAVDTAACAKQEYEEKTFEKCTIGLTQARSCRSGPSSTAKTAATAAPRCPCRAPACQSENKLNKKERKKETRKERNKERKKQDEVISVRSSTLVGALKAHIPEINATPQVNWKKTTNEMGNMKLNFLSFFLSFFGLLFGFVVVFFHVICSHSFFLSFFLSFLLDNPPPPSPLSSLSLSFH